MFSSIQTGPVIRARRCSRSVFALVCLLLVVQAVPRLGRAMRSLALGGHVSWGPVRRAIPEVPSTSPEGAAEKRVSWRYSPERAPVEQFDRRLALRQSHDADRSLPLSQFACCRELPRSHPCDTDGVIALCA